MPKKNKNKNKNNNNGNVRNIIDNRNVWIEASSSSINKTILLQSDNGEGVYTILDGSSDKKYDYEYHTKTEFGEKRICPFCNPTAKIDHIVCKECAEHVIKHTANCEQICQYIEYHSCNCEYCQILVAP